VIIAPIVVQYAKLGVVGWLVVAALVAVLLWAIVQSKRPAPEIKLQETSAAD